jgi:short-subunit dehydrogenase involved in D-alanine esterification of teichoic acids
MEKLEGKIAVVTDGNSGIGFAIAQRFVADGAHIYLVPNNHIIGIIFKKKQSILISMNNKNYLITYNRYLLINTDTYFIV